VVTFDESFAKYIKDLNKEKEKTDVTKETKEESEKLSTFMKNRKFYCFHGDHRREAINLLHNVI